MGVVPLETAFAALRRGDVAAVYYLTGVEEILKDDLIAAVARAVLDPAARDFNLDIRSAADLDGETLHALVETPPLLAPRRLVVVRGIDQWRKNAKVWDILYRYLQHPSPTTVLVLTQPGDAAADPRIAGAAAHVTVSGLKPEHVARWLARRAEAAGASIEPDAAVHLVAAVGGELGQLAVEIEKLAAASGDGRISVDEVSRLVGVRRGETLYDWVDAVLARDTRRAVELLDVVLERPGGTGVQLIMTLGTALVGTRLARALADGGTPWGRLPQELKQRLRAARPPRLRDWAVECDAWTAAARRWTARELGAALAAAAAADGQLKSTTISDERGILTSMLLAFPPTRAAA
jgi:DNA polymerase-3 subunit delta